MEIERKFLIESPPDGFDSFPASQVEQAYVAVDPAGTEVRIRRRAGNTTLTIKGGTGLARAEEEIAIAAGAFERLWDLAAGRVVRKRRYEIPAGDGLTIELDVYEEGLEGLVVAEVEFDSAAEAERFVPPAWFGAEVTDDDAYKNWRLAVDGRPGAG